MKRVITLIAIIGVLGATAWILLQPKKASAPTTPSSNNTSQGSTSKGSTTSGFNKQLYSISDPTSIWVIASKSRPLNPIDYAPTDLVTPNVPLRLSASSSEMQVRREAANAMEQMFTAAKQAKVNLMLASGYRSYQEQVTVYNNEVANYGQATADTESARPGHSEHQTGLAADLEDTGRKCEINACFADLPEGKWVAANAYKYGFIVRYQADKVAITGYRYEPWHVRYIGVALAAEMHKEGITTLEEFFNVVPASQPY